MAKGNGGAAEPLGFLVMHPGSRDEQPFPIYDRIYVGRECGGIGESQRVLIDDPEVSRNHFEIRLDAEHDQAYVIDTSTNGTRVNGARIERAVPLLLRSGDRITVGGLDLDFRSNHFAGEGAGDARQTQARISLSTMVMVVGDITNYSTIAQATDTGKVAQSLHVLWDELGKILTKHQGTLNHYAGDALYAVWELEQIPEANQLAINFVLAADQRVEEIGPELALRGPDGSTINMGWGVVQGDAAVTTMTRSLVSVIGDATNLAFRLSGLAGRDGRAPVVVTQAVRDAAADLFVWGKPEQVETKGRSGKETVFPVLGRV